MTKKPLKKYVFERPSSDKAKELQSKLENQKKELQSNIELQIIDLESSFNVSSPFCNEN